MFSPTDRLIVKQGDVVTPKDLERLKRAAETSRNDIAENAHREIDALKADSGHIAERLTVDYQGQIDSVQTQLESQRVDRRHRLEQLRRDLEGLKKMDLIQENRYRELRDAFGSNVFRAGMGAEAVRELIAAISLDKLAAELRNEIGATIGQGRKKPTKGLTVAEAFRNQTTEPEWLIVKV